MEFWRIAVATGVLLTLALAPAGAEVGLQAPGVTAGAPAAVPSPAPECWLNHAQVQPPPPRDPLADQSLGDRYRLASADQHPGAEHPTPAGMRPCNALPPPNVTAGEQGLRP